MSYEPLLSDREKCATVCTNSSAISGKVMQSEKLMSGLGEAQCSHMVRDRAAHSIGIQHRGLVWPKKAHRRFATPFHSSEKYPTEQDIQGLGRLIQQLPHSAHLGDEIGGSGKVAFPRVHKVQPPVATS